MKNKSVVVAYPCWGRGNLFNSEPCWHHKYMGNNLAFTTQKIILPFQFSLWGAAVAVFRLLSRLSRLRARPAVWDSAGTGSRGRAIPAQPPSLRSQARARPGSCSRSRLFRAGGSSRPRRERSCAGIAPCAGGSAAGRAGLWWEVERLKWTRKQFPRPDISLPDAVFRQLCSF